MRNASLSSRAGPPLVYHWGTIWELAGHGPGPKFSHIASARGWGRESDTLGSTAGNGVGTMFLAGGLWWCNYGIERRHRLPDYCLDRGAPAARAGGCNSRADQQRVE